MFYTFRNLVSERTPGFFYLLRHSDDFSIACHLWPLENSTVLLREHENQKDKPRLSMAGKIVLTQEHLKGSLRFPGSPDFTLRIAALKTRIVLGWKTCAHKRLCGLLALRQSECVCGCLVSSLFTPAGQDGEAGGGGWELVPQPFRVEVGTSNQEAAELPIGCHSRAVWQRGSLAQPGFLP